MLFCDAAWQAACRLAIGTRGDYQSPRRMPSCPTGIAPFLTVMPLSAFARIADVRAVRGFYRAQASVFESRGRLNAPTPALEHSAPPRQNHPLVVRTPYAIHPIPPRRCRGMSARVEPHPSHSRERGTPARRNMCENSPRVCPRTPPSPPPLSALPQFP